VHPPDAEAKEESRVSRAAIIIRSSADRRRAAAWASKAPIGCRIEFKEAKRTLDQNARMWAMLTDVAQQVRWHRLKLSADDWKLVFLDALKREVRMVPNIDGNGFVSLGRSSSDLSKSEFADLIELILMFGARHDVQFSERQETEAA
jgi:hypothetical protein